MASNNSIGNESITTQMRDVAIAIGACTNVDEQHGFTSHSINIIEYLTIESFTKGVPGVPGDNYIEKIECTSCGE